MVRHFFFQSPVRLIQAFLVLSHPRSITAHAALSYRCCTSTTVQS